MSRDGRWTRDARINALESAHYALRRAAYWRSVGERGDSAWWLTQAALWRELAAH